MQLRFCSSSTQFTLLVVFIAFDDNSPAFHNLLVDDVNWTRHNLNGAVAYATNGSSSKHCLGIWQNIRRWQRWNARSCRTGGFQRCSTVGRWICRYCRRSGITQCVWHQPLVANWCWLVWTEALDVLVAAQLHHIVLRDVRIQQSGNAGLPHWMVWYIRKECTSSDVNHVLRR